MSKNKRQESKLDQAAIKAAQEAALAKEVKKPNEFGLSIST